MTEKKMFRICCILFLISAVSCVLGFIFDINGIRSFGPMLAYGPFMLAGLPYGWVTTKNWNLPFNIITGPIGLAVLIVLRVVLCQLIGGVLFALAAIKHFTGQAKDED